MPGYGLVGFTTDWDFHPTPKDIDIIAEYFDKASQKKSGQKPVKESDPEEHDH